MDYVASIDRKFYECKKLGMSRLDMRWGLWSREMNLELRQRIANKDPLSNELHHVMVYWVQASELLESYCKSRILAAREKKRLIREMLDIKKILRGEKPQMTITENMILKMLGAGKG